jgi:hypothetical protein
MTNLNRRKFLGVAGSGVIGAMIASTPRVTHAESQYDNHPAFEKLRQQTEASLRSVYRAKNDLDLNEFVSNFDDGIIYQDATLGISIPGLKNVTPLFAGLFKTIATPGRLSEFTYATGDVKLGAVAEFVDLPKSFANTAYDALTILDMREGKVLRNTDYWDSAQLSEADIAGPASKTGIAFPAVPIHPDGPLNPRSAAEFTVDASDSTHASPELLEFVTRFHKEVSSGSFAGAAKLFTDDALLIHPLLHRGDYGYGPFNETIQIRGADNILRMLKAALKVLPDGAKSQLLHVVGGPAGGGLEWRAGGAYANKGFDRKGIRGATSIDLFRGRIRRLSVKFDTVQMTAPVRDSVRKVLAEANLGQDS